MYRHSFTSLLLWLNLPLLGIAMSQATRTVGIEVASNRPNLPCCMSWFFKGFNALGFASFRLGALLPWCEPPDIQSLCNSFRSFPEEGQINGRLKKPNWVWQKFPPGSHDLYIFSRG